MPSSEAELSKALRRVPRWWLVPVVAVLSVVGLLAAFWAGAASAPATVPSAVPSEVPVYAAVERRAVSQQVTLPGKVVAGAVSTVVAARPPGVDRLVVMAPSRKIGDKVVPGELLAVVSDRPLLVLPATVPLYRDLFLGDTGNDVTALQHALTTLGYRANSRGVFDASTQAALEAWYEAVGQTAPSGSPISVSRPGSGISSSGQSTEVTPPETTGVVFRWREFVQIPRDSGRIASMASAGTVLAEDGILARLTIADDTIVARADLLQADALPAGNLVTVRAGSITADLKITSLSAFKDGDPGQNLIPGKDLVIALPAGIKGFSRDQSVTITSGKEASKSLAVPLIAIRQEQGAAFVEAETPEGLKRVDVEVIAQADGWAGIAENEALPVNTRVRLP